MFGRLMIAAAQHLSAFARKAGCAILFCFALLAAQAATAIPVERGDVLSITVAEAPSMNRTAKIDADGRIMLPVLGSITVAGMDVDQIRKKIRAALMDGNLIRNPTVLVEVSAYRPFYVGGAVAHPGAFPYNPGLDVRQGIVLAGGTFLGTRAAAPSPENVIQLTADSRTTAFQLLQVEARIARLRVELGLTPKFTLPAADDSLAGSTTKGQLIELAKGVLQDNRNGATVDKSHTKNLLKLVQVELNLLDQKTNLQTAEQAAEQKDIQRARNLQSKGIVPLDRVKELERQSRLLAVDMLNTQALISRAQQTEETVAYASAKSEVDRRTALQTSLSDSLLQREQLSAKLQALTGRLLAAGLTTNYAAAFASPTPQVTIYRTADGTTQQISAKMETNVLPGDVLEVTLVTPQHP